MYDPVTRIECLDLLSKPAGGLEATSTGDWPVKVRTHATVMPSFCFLWLLRMMSPSKPHTEAYGAALLLQLAPVVGLLLVQDTSDTFGFWYATGSGAPSYLLHELGCDSHLQRCDGRQCGELCVSTSENTLQFSLRFLRLPSCYILQELITLTTYQFLLIY